MQLSSNNAAIITAKAATFIVNGKPYSVNASNATLFEAVKALAREGKYEEIPDTIDRATAIAKKIETKAQGFAKISVRDRRVYLTEGDKESRLQGYEVTKLLELLDEGFNIEPLSNFIIRVRQNPDESIRSRLYEFMEYGNLPLTEDGSFLAYKVVRGNYKDKHSGTFDNSVGKTCEMPRSAVDDNDHNTCSRGLHVCSKEYIQHFLYSGSDRLMVTKVAPEDVVSIPTDYNNTKMRTCRYTVIAEITAAEDPAFFGKVVYAPTPDVEDQEDEFQDDWGSDDEFPIDWED